MNAHNSHFGCFALQRSSASLTVVLSTAGLDGQPTRHRRMHGKSRLGCKNCKMRKIKCDEEQPCRNCVKRNLRCTYVTYSKLSSTIRKGRELIQQRIKEPSTIPDPQVSSINLQHMQLLFHFQTFTSATFIMDPDKWKETVIALALQNSFLMHAVFLMAATHLQHLQPCKKENQITALEHLSKALPMFRYTLATTTDFRGGTAEALIACSMLLLQHSWTHDSEDWGTMLGLYRGLTNIVIESMVMLTFEESQFTSMLAHSPKMSIEQHLRDTAAPSAIKDIFTHCISCTKISDTQAESPNDLLDPSRRLITILYALRLGYHKLETIGLMLDVARYLFSWPNLLPRGFINMIKTKDSRAQVIMLYYFAAVSRLRDDRFWWMRERGVYMFKAIFSHIGAKCEHCTNQAVEIFNEEDLE